MRPLRPGFLVLAVLVLAWAPGTLRAQAAATVVPTDPVYADLERLEAFGLVPRGVSSQRPLSVGRMIWLTGEAQGWLQARGDELDATVRADLEALVGRVERRLGVGRDGPASILLEGELGGGRSPGALLPDGVGVGVVDAVSNPLWAYLGGRSYGDRATAAASGRMDLALAGQVAVSVGGRAATWDATGLVGGRGDATVEVAAARVVLGSVAVEVGRSATVWGRSSTTPLLLSGNGVPLDLVRLSTDRPLRVYLLGDLDFTVFVADLGPRQHFPHTKEIGIRLDLRPADRLTVGISTLNKQGGDGAPPATVAQRIWDASVFGPAVFGDHDSPFSDKFLGVDLRWAFRSFRGLEITAAGTLTDFEKLRIGDILDVAGGYRAGLSWPRLGASQRHSLALEGQRIGMYVYRHHQFRSGLATEGLLQGSALGPDARAALIRYGYHRPSARFRLELEGTIEGRSADSWGNRYNPRRDVYKTEDLPDQVRMRLAANFTYWLAGGAGLFQVRSGLERVRNPDYPAAGPSRTGAAILVRLQWAYQPLG